MLETQISQATVSWIWGSILQSIKLLRAGACYQVGTNSSLKIKVDPWMPNVSNFRILEEMQLPYHFLHIRDL